MPKKELLAWSSAGAAGRGQAAGPPPDVPARLRTAVARITRRLRRAGGQERLTPTQISALVTVQAHGPLRLSALAAREGISPSTISRLVDSLEQGEALVERRVDAGDARALQVVITPAGTALLEDLRRNGAHLIDMALRSLDEQERDAVHIALPAIEKMVGFMETTGI